MKALSAAIVLSSISVAPAALTPQTANASVCTTPYCGGVVYNGSSDYTIKITNCWSDSYGLRLYQDEPPCAGGHINDAYDYNADFELPRRDGSQYYYYYYDTDAFRVYRGCRVNWSEAGSTYAIDRHGLSSVWVKISNGEQITVSSIVC